MEQVKVDRANINDVQAICTLYEELGNFHSEALPEIFTYGSKKEQQEIIDVLSNVNYVVFVARLGCQVIGVAVGVIKESFDHPSFVKRKYGWIDAMAVKAEYRSKGVGRTLLKALHDWFLAQDIRRVELNVYAFNDNAIMLYEKQGYSVYKMVMSVDL